MGTGTGASVWFPETGSSSCPSDLWLSYWESEREGKPPESGWALPPRSDGAPLIERPGSWDTVHTPKSVQAFTVTNKLWLLIINTGSMRRCLIGLGVQALPGVAEHAAFVFFCCRTLEKRCNMWEFRVKRAWECINKTQAGMFTAKVRCESFISAVFGRDLRLPSPPADISSVFRDVTATSDLINCS